MACLVLFEGDHCRGGGEVKVADIIFSAVVAEIKIKIAERLIGAEADMVALKLFHESGSLLDITAFKRFLNRPEIFALACVGNAGVKALNVASAGPKRFFVELNQLAALSAENLCSDFSVAERQRLVFPAEIAHICRRVIA